MEKKAFFVKNVAYIWNKNIKIIRMKSQNFGMNKIWDNESNYGENKVQLNETKSQNHEKKSHIFRKKK